MAHFEAVIRDVLPETPDTVTLLLEIADPPPYRAGQFLSIDPLQMPALAPLAGELAEKKGRKERPRAYSLASAPHEPLVAITVKEDPPGEFPALLSPWLVHQAKPGDRLPCIGFSGFYCLPDDLAADTHVVHLCAGSGIVPNFGILKDAVHRGLPQHHTLLYSSRRWEDVIFREGLTMLPRTHGGQVKVVHALTRDQAAPPATTVHPARIDDRLIRDHVPDLAKALFLLCGPSIPTHEKRAAKARGETPPPRFLESTKALLEGLGVDRKHILSEGW